MSSSTASSTDSSVDEVRIDSSTLLDMTQQYKEIKFSNLTNKIKGPAFIGTFLDNDNVLLGQGKAYYRYNTKNDELVKLFETDTVLFVYDKISIIDARNFKIMTDNEVYDVKNDELYKKTTLSKNVAYTGCDINLYVEKYVCCDSNGDVYISDLEFKNTEKLPFQNIYKAKWIDDANILMASKLNNEFFVYNVNTKATKEFVMTGSVMGDPYYDSEHYFGFEYLEGYYDFDKFAILNKTNHSIKKFSIEKMIYAPNLQSDWIAYYTIDSAFCIYNINTKQNYKVVNNVESVNENIPCLVSPDAKTTIIVYNNSQHIYSTN